MTSLRDKRPSKANVFSASKKPHGLEYLTKQKGIREIDWSLTARERPPLVRYYVAIIRNVNLTANEC